MRKLKYTATAAPISSWPSWPMLIKPALDEITVPRATKSRGAAIPRVPPHRPGAKMLPSTKASTTGHQSPPVASTITLARVSATATLRA